MKQQVSIASKQFQPRNEYVLVSPAEGVTEKTTESGIVISIGTKKSSLDRPTSGTIVSVGVDIEDLAPGDFVLWPGTDGLDLEMTDGDFVLLRNKSIIGSKKA
mgnify:CR=1 FL=1